MRLLIVSNRLPVTVKDDHGTLSYQESVGGLSKGLSTYLESARRTNPDFRHVWIGWPGATVEPQHQLDVVKHLRTNYHAHPVFLSELTMEKFYHGFCNSTIWPLFHYFPGSMICEEEYWPHYVEVNRLFCSAVLDIMEPGDAVWIHDYQLMLLPAMLREHKPDLAIGFFLHIPFPDFEVYRLLPKEWKIGILEGLLGANLIGFHTHDYTQYFLRCVLRILGHDHKLSKIITGKNVVRADTFPMGVDFEHFYEAAAGNEVRIEKEKLQPTLLPYRVILSVDRLDYTKGVLNRLKGYEYFLERNPSCHGKVVMIMLVVPSRTEVKQYQQMKKKIDELVGRINGRFGTIDWTPTRYQFSAASFEHLVALYGLSDICLVTPLRDGMNLIAKEYVASRPDQTGVLILSETAGAAKELQEAIIINPNSVPEIADALNQALVMPREEQISRNQRMQTRLKRYNVVRWAEDFIRSLQEARKDQKHFDARIFGESQMKELLFRYSRAAKRLILLDYDGTLVPFASEPKKAVPSAEVLQILGRLCADERNECVIISGRDIASLESWLGHLNVSLVAEHGAFVRVKGSDWKELRPVMKGWKPEIRHKLEMVKDRLPGSMVEEKDCSLVWHYRNADPEAGFIVVKELIDELTNFTANIDLQVIQGNKIVEIRVSGVNKGTGGMYFLKSDFDFILAIGDDWTDEDLFQVLPKNAFSIRVGMAVSHAKYNIVKPEDVQNVLNDLLSASGSR